MASGLYGSSTTQNLPRVATAELIGTYLLVLTGTAVAVSALLDQPIAGAPADSLAIALAFGLALVALVNALGHVSGAHLNPAVTLALAVTGAFPWRYVPAYLAAQLGGAVLASLTVWATYGDAARDQASLAATLPGGGVSVGSVLLIEAVPEIPIWLSLSVILGVLVIATVASLAKTRGETPDDDTPAEVAQGETPVSRETTGRPAPAPEGAREPRGS